MKRTDLQIKLSFPPSPVTHNLPSLPLYFCKLLEYSLISLYFLWQKKTFSKILFSFGFLSNFFWVAALIYILPFPRASLWSEEIGSPLQKYKKRIELFQVFQHAPKDILESLKEWDSPSTESENSNLSNPIAFYQKACLSALIPLFSEEQKKTKEALDSAEESFAESLAGEHFSKATDLYSEGEVLTAGLSSRLEEIQKEKDPSQKETLIESLLQDAELGLSKWRESIDMASKSLSLSLSQASALHYSQSDLLDTLQLIRKYRPSHVADSVQLTILEKDLEEGLSWILKGRIKHGFAILEDIRKKLNEQVAFEFRGFAKNKLEDSQAKLEAAEKHIQLHRSKFEEDPETLAQLEDNLRAARESHTLADQLYQEEKFIESITGAEDSLFLTERFQEDLDSATVPEKRIYQEDPNPIKKNFTGLHLPKIHKVQKGESLVGISEFYFKSHKKWKAIYQKNKKSILQPNKIFPSQILILPTP